MRSRFVDELVSMANALISTAMIDDCRGSKCRHCGRMADLQTGNVVHSSDCPVSFSERVLAEAGLVETQPAHDAPLLAGGRH